MGLLSFVRPTACAVLTAGALAASTACGHSCGLAQHAQIQANQIPVACCGGFVFQDVSLKGATSGAEFELVNTAKLQPGSVDAFLVPTSCAKLFDAAYPGAAPLCTVYVGPARPGGVSARVRLDPGTYRVFLQGYSANTETATYLVDVMIWDYRCGPTS